MQQDNLISFIFFKKVEWKCETKFILGIYLIFMQNLALLITKQTKKCSNFVALSPQANYTDWATAICRPNLVPAFVDRGVLRGQRGGSPTVVNLSFLDRNRYFSFTYLLIYPHEIEWIPFQTHCYSENLVAPGIEPGITGSAARKSDQ
jgi:hypothetical protein